MKISNEKGFGVARQGISPNRHIKHGFGYTNKVATTRLLSATASGYYPESFQHQSPHMVQ
jgi:hypothetical protein